MRRTRVAVIAGGLVCGALGIWLPLSGTAQQPPIARPAQADLPAPDGKPPAPRVFKLYDVSDLTSGVLPFKLRSDILPPSIQHFAKDTQGWNGLFCGRKRENADVEPLGAITMDTLIDVIAGQLLEPGAPPEMREVGGMLAVSTDAPTHEKIAEVVQQIRAARPLGRSVEVTAHWVLIEPDKVSALYKQGTREIDAQKLATPVPGALYVRAAARTVTGQAVTLLSGRARTLISDQSPSVGQSAAAYDPDVAQVLSGLLATVDVRVRGNTATASVATAAADWDEPAKSSRIKSVRGGMSSPSDTTVDVPDRGAPDAPPPSIRIPAPSPAVSPAESTAAEVDRLNMVAMQFHTTVQVALGKPTLIGGMTLEPATGATPSKGDPRQLYLIMQVDLAETEAAKPAAK